MKGPRFQVHVDMSVGYTRKQSANKKKHDI